MNMNVALTPGNGSYDNDEGNGTFKIPSMDLSTTKSFADKLRKFIHGEPEQGPADKA